LKQIYVAAKKCDFEFDLSKCLTKRISSQTILSVIVLDIPWVISNRI